MKAILVIDTPKDCLYCPCYDQDTEFGFEQCKVLLRSFESADERDNKPDWCPLKPFNENALKSGNKEYLIYQRDWLYKNLDREIEMLKSGKKYFDEILGEYDEDTKRSSKSNVD